MSQMSTSTTSWDCCAEGSRGCVSDLLALTYAEFDNHVGPQLKYSFPPDVLAKDAFEAISDYVILGKHLCDRLILVSLERFQLLSFSVAIENPKYERNCLTFAFGFVLRRSADIDAYGKALSKLVSSFVDLEMEYEFLFQATSKAQLPEILRSLFLELKHKHSAFVAVRCLTCNNTNNTNSSNNNTTSTTTNSNNAANNTTINSSSSNANAHNNHLNPALPLQQLPLLASEKRFHYLSVQVLRSPVLPLVHDATVRDHDVPLFRGEKIHFASLPWDASFQHIVMYIDGVSHVKKIAREAVMDLDMVKKALSLLVFHGAVIIADIFKFTNVYVLNEDYMYGNAAYSVDSAFNVGTRAKTKTYTSALSLLGDAAILTEMRDFACMGLVSMPNLVSTLNSASCGGAPRCEELPSFTDIVDFLLQLQPSRSVAQVLLASLNPSSPTALADAPVHGRDRSRTSSGAHSDEALLDYLEDDAHNNNTNHNNNHSTMNHLNDSPSSAEMESPQPHGFVHKLMNLDIVRLLAFAQFKGIIRRMHEHPVYIPTKSTEPAPLPPPFILDSPTTGKSLNSANSSRARLHSDDILSTTPPFAEQPSGTQPGRTFSKLSSRARTVVGRAFVRDPTTNANTMANSKCSTSASTFQSIPDIIQALDGTEHLDSICCKYGLNFLDVVGSPGVHVIYK